MFIIKIILILSKFEIVIYANNNFVLKEFYEHNTKTQSYLYNLDTTNYLFIDHIKKIQHDQMITESEFFYNQWALEGFEEISRLVVKEDFKYLGFEAITYKTFHTFPNSNSLFEVKKTYAHIPIINNFISNNKYLNLLQLVDSKDLNNYFNIEVELCNKDNQVIKQIKSIEIIEVETTFFENQINSN